MFSFHNTNCKIEKKKIPVPFNPLLYASVQVGGEESLPQSITLRDLVPGEMYELLVKAENPSGVTEAEIFFLH